MFSVVHLPRVLETHLTRLATLSWQSSSGIRTDFASPLREDALIPHDSVSWQVFKNPVALLVGGIAAVILELAEPRIRTAIWKKSTFLADPLGRLQRTGLAAMVTIFAARSVAEPMIARVGRLHSRVSGVTPAGTAFSADDPQLLAWVHVTATWSFAMAYSRYVQPLTPQQMDAMCEEAAPVSRLYGALDAPTRWAGFTELLQRTTDELEPSAALLAFMRIMGGTPLLPRGLRWLQPLAVRAAVEILPQGIRDRLGLDERHGLGLCDDWVLRLAGSVADRLVLPMSPASQSCIRLGLPASYLYQ